MSEKTHQPTEQKRRKAREDGNIPKSKMLSAAAVTLGGLVGTVVFARDSAARLMGFTHRLLSLSGGTPEAELLEGVRLLGVCVAPTLAGALFGALAAGLPMAAPSASGALFVSGVPLQVVRENNLMPWAGNRGPLSAIRFTSSDVTTTEARNAFSGSMHRPLRLERR